MSIEFYVGDEGIIPVTVEDANGNLVTPEGALATVMNLSTGVAVATDENCLVGEGLAYWPFTSGHPVSMNSGRYVAYVTVQIDVITTKTAAVPFDVLDKGSYLVVDRWRRKVEFAAPNDEALTDQEGRDWVDQAVGYLSRSTTFGYESSLATITPAPDASTLELVASVAALMARTAWWAGKGTWRDEEMSFDASPFAAEWKRLETQIESGTLAEWFTGPGPLDMRDMYNRDKTDRWGIPNDPDDYYDAVWVRDEPLI